MSDRFPPSERRRREARAQGLVAVSPLASSAAALAAAAVALGATGRGACARLLELSRGAFEGHMPVEHALSGALGLGARLVLPVLAAAFVAALGAGLVQSRGLFTLGAFGRPAGDPSPRPVLAWGLAAALAAVALVGARDLVRELARADGLLPAAAGTLGVLGQLAPRALALFALAGVVDWAWRRAALEQALGMTREEREREEREEEGDPRLRAERRRRHRALAGSSLVDDVARAAVVVTAPGLAAALGQKGGVLAVVAAGDGLIAARIIDIARRLGVPVRADDALAVALSALGRGDPVPAPLQGRVRLPQRRT
jgi:flagellar biosynthesis protein FlhB